MAAETEGGGVSPASVLVNLVAIAGSVATTLIVSAQTQGEETRGFLRFAVGGSIVEKPVTSTLVDGDLLSVTAQDAQGIITAQITQDRKFAVQPHAPLMLPARVGLVRWQMPA